MVSPDGDTLAAIIDTQPYTCPSSYAAGCRCAEHAPGLLQFSRDPAALAAALAPCRETATLRVLTTDPQPNGLIPLNTPTHDGSMTCRCVDCEQERAQWMTRRRQPVRQPWEPIRRKAA